MPQLSQSVVPPRPAHEERAPDLADTPEEVDFFVGRMAPIDLEAGAPLHCADCGERTPRTDLLFSERGQVCLDCHGEDEIAGVDLTPWRHVTPILAMIAGLVFVAVSLPQVARIVLSLGPTGAIAWAVMNLLPASFGVFLVIAALRMLRDALTNPLAEEVSMVDQVLRSGTSGLAVVASVACTLAFPVMALWPFL
ncbi:MAG: hypothetical protein AAF602_03145 [Myxococcota bacterium]